MKELGIIAIIYIISGIIAIAFLIRFWMTMSRIKEIRDLLLKHHQNVIPVVPIVEKATDMVKDDLDALVAKLKSGQCVVLVNKTQRLEIWDKSDWDDVVKAGRENMFKLLHTKFE